MKEELLRHTRLGLQAKIIYLYIVAKTGGLGGLSPLKSAKASQKKSIVYIIIKKKCLGLEPPPPFLNIFPICATAYTYNYQTILYYIDERKFAKKQHFYMSRDSRKSNISINIRKSNICPQRRKCLHFWYFGLRHRTCKYYILYCFYFLLI